MAGNFLFVQMENTDKHKESISKKEIRIHAMREFRRQQRAQRIRHYQQGPNVEVPEGMAEIHDLESNDHDSQVLMRSYSPRQVAPPSINQSAYFATGALDPFSTLPSELDGDHQALLSYFQLIITPILLPGTHPGSKNSWGSRWLEASITSPDLLLATCSHASAHLDTVNGGDISPRTLRLQVAAVRALNLSLETGVSDLNLGAVAVIAANALLSNDPRETEILDIHIDALIRMVRLQGGLEHVGNGRFREALQLAINLLLGPYEQLTQRPHDLSAVMAMLPRSAENLQSTGDLLAECRALTALRAELEIAEEVDMHLLQNFSDRRSALEVRLVWSLRHVDQKYDAQAIQRKLDRAVRQAALLYALCFLRSFPSGGLSTANTIRELVHDVFILLVNDDLRKLGPSHVLRVLWISVMAYKFSAHIFWPYHVQKSLLDVLQALQLTHHDEVSSCLAEIAWSENLWDARLRSLLKDLNIQ